MMLGLLIYCYATGGFGHQCFHGRLKLPKKRPMFSIFLNRQ
jgi:hypothetical protein